MAGYQGDEPSNEFVEFVQVFSRQGDYPVAIIMFESPSGGKTIKRVKFPNQHCQLSTTIALKIADFDVQVGYRIKEERIHNARHLTIVTSAGKIIEIQRKRRGNYSEFFALCNFLSLLITKDYF